MQYPPPPKPSNNRNEKRASLTVRLNHAAHEINPFLIIVAVGLMILNLTCYLGMSVARHSSTWNGQHAIPVSAATAPTEPATDAARN
jgi:hypothetical protein